MAGQARTYHQTLALHREMLNAFGVGAEMPRDTFDAMIMRALCCGYPQAANIAKGGEKLGLWQRVKGKTNPLGGGFPGWVKLNRPPQDEPNRTPNQSNQEHQGRPQEDANAEPFLPERIRGTTGEAQGTRPSAF